MLNALPTAIVKLVCLALVLMVSLSFAADTTGVRPPEAPTPPEAPVSGGAAVSGGSGGAGGAQDTKYPKAKVSFDDFKGLMAEVETHRASRLIDLNTFLKMSKEEGVIILDSRSDFRFDRIHLKGAKHLAFTDFTQDNLKKVVPTFDTKILIYCNNNFEGNQIDFASKIALPPPNPARAAASQFAAQAKPLMMALNIPTYINLYGYGYHNVYELHELVKVNDPRIKFEGTIVDQKPAILPAPPAAK